MSKQRIGIYAGTFDPVHSGHLGFALQALEEAHLSEVYFLPERKPPHKPGAEHYGHRVAMLRQAIKPHSQLALLEIVDKQFAVNRTLPQLQATFSGSQIVFLMGSDMFVGMPEWKNVTKLIGNAEFVVAIRSQDELHAVNLTVQALHIPPKSVLIVDSVRPNISSTAMRYAIRRNNSSTEGLLASVSAYARREWLYASVRQNG